MTKRQIFAYVAILMLVMITLFASLFFPIRRDPPSWATFPPCLQSVTGPDSRCYATLTAIVARQPAIIATQTAAARP